MSRIARSGGSPRCRRYVRSWNTSRHGADIVSVPPQRRHASLNGDEPRSSSGSFDVGGDPPRLVAREEMRRRATAGLILEVDVSERLPVAVADDEAGVGLLDGPGRR